MILSELQTFKRIKPNLFLNSKLSWVTEKKKKNQIFFSKKKEFLAFLIIYLKITPIS